MFASSSHTIIDRSFYVYFSGETLQDSKFLTKISSWGLSVTSGRATKLTLVEVVS